MKNQNIMTTTFLSLAVALLAQCDNPSANNIKPQAQNNASKQQNSLQNLPMRTRCRMAKVRYPSPIIIR